MRVQPSLRRAIAISATALALAMTGCTAGTPTTATGAADSPSTVVTKTPPPAGAATASDDPWNGAKPLAAQSPAIVDELTRTWHLTFNPRTGTDGGTSQEGTAGDPKHLDRQLVALVKSDRDGRLRGVICAGGGDHVAARKDATLRGFVDDCLRLAAGPTAWPDLKHWLDVNYALTTGRMTYSAAGITVDFQASPTWSRLVLAGV